MNKNRLSRTLGAASALAFVALPLTMLGGCDQLGENPLDTLCCSAFKPGTNMASVDWGLEADANLKFGVTMQAIGDFSGTATAMVTDLGTSCRGLAIDLGEAPTAVTAVDPGEATSQWCAKAAAKITEIKADIAISYQPAQCTFSAEVQAGCEGSCTVSGECTPGSVEARCSGGEISGQCEGSCTGSCEGSANVAVSCEGQCEGACEGTCTGNQDGERCEGTCSGKCRGSCEATGDASVACEGQCTGSCSVEFKAPKCTAQIDPPECDLDANCQASCEASASAKAECTPPAVSVTGSENLSLKIAALKKYLPEIILIGEARAELLLGNAEAVVNASANIEGDLEAEAALCIVPAAVAIADAVDNLGITVTASASVLGEIQ